MCDRAPLGAVLLALALHAPAFGAPPPEDPALVPLSAGLRHAMALPPEARRTWLADRHQGDPLTVVIETDDVAATLAVLGAVDVVAGDLVQARVSVDQLAVLARVHGVRAIREPRWASPKETSEGRAEVFDVPWDLDGKGTDVAVVDVGFDGWEDLVGTELGEADGGGGEGEHGTAVAEIVHDMAPEARLHLIPARTDVEFISALRHASEDGFDVVNASIGFDNIWHADGTSAVSRAADLAAAEGVVVVVAAGNEARRYLSGPVSIVGDQVAIDGVTDVPIAADGAAEASLRWSEPFGAAATDLDLVLEGTAGECGRSTEPQNGTGDPYEYVRCSTTEAQVTARIVLVSGDATGLVAWLHTPGGLPPALQRPDGTTSLPADAAGALTVGAYDLDTRILHPDSSRGPTDDGRLKPDLVAPTGVSTATWGERGFDGTSAAAPHVAGLAALLSQHRPHRDPEQVRAWLTDPALDLGEPGPDDLYGAGAVRTGPLPKGCGCASAGPGTSAPALLVLLALRSSSTRSSSCSRRRPSR